MKPTIKTVIDATCHTIHEKELFRAVMRQMGASWSDVWEYPSNYRDPSGGVSGFIYYSETRKFAKRHIENILEVVADYEDETGCHVLGNKDNMPGEDRLNWLAWFALESVIQKVMDYQEAELDHYDEL
jgi:hypothetical protein